MRKDNDKLKGVSEMFSVENLKEMIIDDVIVPGIKNLISSVSDSLLETVGDIVDVALFGERRSKKRGSRNSSRTSYSGYYEKSRNDRTKKDIHRMDRMQDVTFDNRYDAEEVLGALRDVLEETDEVSVADYYELAGVSHTYMDRRYGWTNLVNSYISKNRDGDYIINFPKPRMLD